MIELLSRIVLSVVIALLEKLRPSHSRDFLEMA